MRSFFTLKRFVSFGFFILLTVAAYAKPKRTYFKLTTYHFKNTVQEDLIDGFLKDAYLPMLHKLGVKNVGVFKPIANDTASDKIIYILSAYNNIQQLTNIADKMWDVTTYNVAADGYLNGKVKTPPYTRIENSILSSFEKAPVLSLPKLTSPKNEHIYELRSYEAANEKLHNNKVKMFNEGGEVALFSRLNFNAVFYSKVIAGSKMPNLVYMTSFENRADRDAHWKSFSADPEWKKLSSMPEYQNNVSKSDIILMKAADYSDY